MFHVVMAAALAAPLDPLAFPSLGAMPIGTAYVDTDALKRPPRSSSTTW